MPRITSLFLTWRHSQVFDSRRGILRHIMRGTVEKADKFGGQGLPPSNIIDVVKKVITFLSLLFYVGTLYTDRLRSTDVSP